jgi:hypothetical protein
MGFMTTLFGNGKLAAGSSSNADHSINKGGALAHTEGSVPSPQNADFSSIRSAPVVEKPRYFTVNEMKALQTLAVQKREQVEATRASYRALRSIDSSDTEVHETHRKYQTRLAHNELAKIQSNTKMGEALHALRPEYEKLNQRMETADRSASDKINAIRQTYGG